MAGGSIVSPQLRDRLRGMASPIAVAFGRIGLTPNHLTLIGFAIAVAGAVAAADQRWQLAGILVLFGSAFDLLDGALARATNRVSRLGAFYDSVFDRWGEGVVYIGIAYGFGSAGFNEAVVLPIAAAVAAFMVSYSRAKSEGLGFTAGSTMANVGLAPREVRTIILAAGLLLATGPILELPPVGAACAGVCDFPQGGSLGIALLLITILATITTIQRILHVRAQAQED
jgi:phosphatidylglycerophosphate synthase